MPEPEVVSYGPQLRKHEFSILKEGYFWWIDSKSNDDMMSW